MKFQKTLVALGSALSMNAGAQNTPPKICDTSKLDLGFINAAKRNHGSIGEHITGGSDNKNIIVTNTNKLPFVFKDAEGKDSAGDDTVCIMLEHDGNNPIGINITETITTGTNIDDIHEVTKEVDSKVVPNTLKTLLVCNYLPSASEESMIEYSDNWLKQDKNTIAYQSETPFEVKGLSGFETDAVIAEACDREETDEPKPEGKSKSFPWGAATAVTASASAAGALAWLKLKKSNNTENDNHGQSNQQDVELTPIMSNEIA